MVVRTIDNPIRIAGGKASWSWPRGRFGSRQWLLAASLLVLLFILLTALFPAWFATKPPAEMSMAILQPPGAAHLLGTDQFGRDIYSLLVYGSRQSLLIGIGSVLIGGLIGSLFGLVAGYRGGWLDSLLMRVVVSASRGRSSCGRSSSCWMKRCLRWTSRCSRRSSICFAPCSASLALRIYSSPMDWMWCATYRTGSALCT